LCGEFPFAGSAFSKGSCLPQNVFLQSDTELQQNLMSLIATGCKDLANQTPAPRSIGAVPATLVYCKFCLCYREFGVRFPTEARNFHFPKSVYTSLGITLIAIQ
jgi:hypothetical protein